MSDNTVPVKSATDGDIWTPLRRLTTARIGLERSGASLSTGPLLDLRLAHARARDAVHANFNESQVAGELVSLGLPVLTVASSATDKQDFLMRPDRGRMLQHDSETILKSHADTYDVVFVVSDGLSARAVQTHAAPVLAHVIPKLRAERWRLAPLVIVRHGRVAIGDCIAGLLRANCVAVLIGERPGLSAPDSMGAYVTWQPTSHTTDADRNCISNIRPDGISYADAGFKLAQLMNAMRTHQFSGVRLKDTYDRPSINGAPPPIDGP